jgi:stalled ribosome rescue protein Dom34
MDTTNNVGIWMDHFDAHLIDPKTEKNNCSIASKFTPSLKEEALKGGENAMHVIRKQMQEAYYKEIFNEISKYDHVFFFGPTSAQQALYNYLNKGMHSKKLRSTLNQQIKSQTVTKYLYDKAI